MINIYFDNNYKNYLIIFSYMYIQILKTLKHGIALKFDDVNGTCI